MNVRRFEYLDSIRGLAAFIVLIAHYMAAFYPYALFYEGSNYVKEVTFHGFEHIFLYPFLGIFTAGHFAVSLFFVLSGFVLSYRILGEKGVFLKVLGKVVKRPIRLLGMVLFGVVVAAILWKLELFFNKDVASITSSSPWFFNYWKNELNLLTFFNDLFLNIFSKGKTYNAPLWTIYYELYGSLLVYLFLVFPFNKWFRLIVLGTAIFYLRDSLYQGFFLGVLLADLIKNHNFYIKNSFVVSLLFIFGLLFSSYPAYIKMNVMENLFFWNLFPANSNLILKDGYIMLGALLIMVSVLNSERLQKSLLLNVMKKLGELSYSIYVVHFLVLGSISSYLFLIFIDMFNYHISFLIVFVISIFLVVYISKFTNTFVDKKFIGFADFIENKFKNFFKERKWFQS